MLDETAVDLARRKIRPSIQKRLQEAREVLGTVVARVGANLIGMGTPGAIHATRPCVALIEPTAAEAWKNLSRIVTALNAPAAAEDLKAELHHELADFFFKPLRELLREKVRVASGGSGSEVARASSTLDLEVQRVMVAIEVEIELFIHARTAAGGGIAMASDGTPDGVDIEERQVRRFAFLSELFDTVGGVADRTIDWTTVFARLRFPMKENWNTVMPYLRAEGLLNYGNGGWVSITHLGLKEVEAARKKPAEPTAHFLPNIVTHIASVVVGAGAIFQAGQGNIATIQAPRELGELERASILHALAALATAAEAAHADDVVAEIRDTRVKVEDRTVSAARVVAAIGVVSTLVQGVANLPPAYQVFKAALAAVGITGLP